MMGAERSFQLNNFLVLSIGMLALLAAVALLTLPQIGAIGSGDGHADVKHVDEAEQAREVFRSDCPPVDYEELLEKETNKHVFICKLATGRAAIWVLVQATAEQIAAGSPAWREVTAFVSKNLNYVNNLVSSGKYEIVK